MSRTGQSCARVAWAWGRQQRLKGTGIVECDDDGNEAVVHDADKQEKVNRWMAVPKDDAGHEPGDHHVSGCDDSPPVSKVCPRQIWMEANHVVVVRIEMTSSAGRMSCQDSQPRKIRRVEGR